MGHIGHGADYRARRHAWSGDKSSCNTYTYAQNGDYQIIVTAYHNDADAPGDPAAGTPTAPGSRWP